jgi:hypothetical protein
MYYKPTETNQAEKLMTNQEMQNKINSSNEKRLLVIKSNKVDVDFKPALRTFTYRKSPAIKASDL